MRVTTLLYVGYVGDGHRQGHPDCTLLTVAEEEALRAEEEARAPE